MGAHVDSTPRMPHGVQLHPLGPRYGERQAWVCVLEARTSRPNVSELKSPEHSERTRDSARNEARRVWSPCMLAIFLLLLRLLRLGCSGQLAVIKRAGTPLQSIGGAKSSFSVNSPLLTCAAYIRNATGAYKACTKVNKKRANFRAGSAIICIATEATLKALQLL